ncbi:MAG: protoheme IX farnesyltransferase [Methylococcales bacterium]|jgi:heme o synthase|nr:protoheme IX farnesyltransferase [Methylococcales bacterium]MBT7445346.1 protoheme IX farnesyltransferase [Methylococcales bacterium]
METPSVNMNSSQSQFIQQCHNYLGLCKLKVVALLVFTAMVGMFLAVPGWPPLQEFVCGLLGIGLAAASAAAINHIVDEKIDEKMGRTKNRPLPEGRVTIKQALVFAIVLGTIAMAILLIWVNVLTAVLTFVSLMFYAVFYTMYLKRATPQNIVIGGAAGAAPPLLGWTALTGEIQLDALILFWIIFIWTPPHFWALAIHRRDEYAKVDIPMLPVTNGVQHTRVNILYYTILLLHATLLPFISGMSGLFYLAGAIVLGLIFIWYAIIMFKSTDQKINIKAFGFSIIYLMALFAFLLIDHYLPPYLWLG